MSEQDQDTNFDDQPTVPPQRAEDQVVEDGQTVLPVSGTVSSRSTPSLSVPHIANYEILDELGRGGMGVVYKARDLKLDRFVALKMILGGKFASNEEIERFRIEGEAAARLDHPGIVPIYETEEVDGNHFFSMKFVEGRSLLDRLDEFKSDSNAICELVARIADAVQHAHQRAVLHRDLKPANILVDDQSNPAITDFGLAKRIDGDSELTQTGLVMGTPGFMSPEQAAGQKDVTTAADIFSLGAILFWLITGKAPFRGETGIQAVMSTIEGEAPSLKSLVANADQDLDLICQKAMNKEPSRRYSSAAAMAEDLRAWIEGEPLSVRPATAMSTASLWVNKNLRTVLASVLSGVLCGSLIGGIFAVGELQGAALQEHQIRELGPDTSTWVSSFIGLRNLSSWWVLLQYLTVPFIAIGAFLCVLVAKPKTRESNIVSAVTCAFAATTVTFMLTAGMGVLNSYSVSSGERDIEILSTAMWLDDEERELAQRALIQRYPGLKEMDQRTRQRRITQKILHDQKSGLLPGIWMAVCIATLFTGVPLALTCVLSGALYREGIRGWEWFGCTWERAAYVLVFFLAVSFWLRPIPPSTIIMLCSLGAIAFALIVALRAKWYWRIAVIPIPFVAMAMINGDIGNMSSAVYDAGRATNGAELRYQLEQNDRSLKFQEDGFRRFASAIGWLYLGDERKYQQDCERLLASFDFAYRPEIASRIAKAYMLRPDLHDPESIQDIARLSEFASEFESSDLVGWLQSTRALVELREGRLNDAIEWNRRSRSGEHTDSYLNALTHVVDSLAHAQSGNARQAENSLEKSKEAMQAGRTKKTLMVMTNPGLTGSYCKSCCSKRKTEFTRLIQVPPFKCAMQLA